MAHVAVERSALIVAVVAEHGHDMFHVQVHLQYQPKNGDVFVPLLPV